MTPASAPSLAIVIVNYRSWRDLEVCLGSLGDAADREVVVVDNCSGDGELARLAARYPSVRWIENSGNHGFAHGCNVGARATSAPLLLFLNPDTRDPNNQLCRFVELAAEHPEAGILTVRQVDQAGRPQRVFDRFPSLLNLFGPVRALLRILAPGAYPDPRRCEDSWRAVDWVSGSALMIRRDLLAALGGWHTGFWMYSEDVDLCRRARDAGAAIGYSASATLVHRHGASSRRNLETAALTRSETVISRHYYATRHLGPLHRTGYHLALLLSRFLPTLLAGALAAVLPVSTLRRRARTARLLAAYYRGVLRSGDWRSPRARRENPPWKF